MRKIFRIYVFVLSFLFSQQVFGADSTFIRIAWYGDVEKPYYEVIFHQENGFKPISQHSFSVEFALDKVTFFLLKDFVSHYIGRIDSSSSEANDRFIQYFAGCFYGVDSTLMFKYLDRMPQLNSLRLHIESFFLNTEFESGVKEGWKRLFGRLGVHSD